MKKLLLIILLGIIPIGIMAEKPVKMYDVFIVGEFKQSPQYEYRDKTDHFLKRYYTPVVICTWAIVESFLYMNEASAGTQTAALVIGMNLWVIPIVVNEFKYY